MARLREYYYNGGDMLSASEMLRSESTSRTKTIIEYGKYAETMRASMFEETSKKL